MEHFIPIVAMIIPIVAIIGGIGTAIVRIITQARLEELARRERIAAIERGVDPEKLPPIVSASQDAYGLGDSRLRRAHGLLIGAFILIAVGLGTAVIFQFVEPEKHHWVIGVLPAVVGVALLASAWVVWPRGPEQPATRKSIG